LFSDLVQKVIPATVLKEYPPAEGVVQLIAIVVTLLGVYIGYVLYYRNKRVVEQWKQSAGMIAVRGFLFRGWGFDQLYDAVFVKPFVFITRINKTDVFDQLYKGIAQANLRFNRLLSVSQNGSLRWYIVGVLIGILFIITLQLVL
jgi:NADH-quinone oxidoreductase subunit L